MEYLVKILSLREGISPVKTFSTKKEKVVLDTFHANLAAVFQHLKIKLASSP